ncbi:hypothetical protein ABE83_00240 [Streptomyces sp. CFMR 7]|nr:hypothetical protein ABE83_00240 [Streptomyces sp. CFMR 7]
MATAPSATAITTSSHSRIRTRAEILGSPRGDRLTVITEIVVVIIVVVGRRGAWNDGAVRCTGRSRGTARRREAAR